MTDALAMVLEEKGAPLKLVRRAIPEPARGQAILRVRATSLNFHDYMNVSGAMPRLPYPRVPFSDACGEVVAMGADVTRVAVGDRVAPNFFVRWQGGRPSTEACAIVYGDQIDGGLQEYMLVEADSLVKVPAHLTDLEAATLGCAGLTAWRSVSVEAQVRAGDTVVVQGTGGVSLFALGFAKMLGARVIVTSSSDEKLERARDLGADHLINYRTAPDWERDVVKFTGGRGADLVVDVGGVSTFARSIRAARMDGHISVIGALSGAEKIDFPMAAAMARNVTIRGITVGSRAHFEDVCRAMEVSQYRPVLHHEVFDMEDASSAINLMKSQAHFGKIAIRAPA